MIHATLCYIEREDEYLMLLRNKKKNDLNEGKWIGVGGKLEQGETPEECLLREVKEETGLTLTSYEKRGIIHFRSDVWEAEEMHLYTADGFTGEMFTDCMEGELHWVKKEKIMDLNLWEGDVFFLERLIKGDKDIEMTLSYAGDDLVEKVIIK